VNVLLAIDESCHSTAATAAVRQQFDPAVAKVRVLHVVEWPRNLPTPFSFAEGPAAADSVLAVHDSMREAGRELLAHALSQLGDAGFEATSVLAEGDVRGAILDEAAGWPADVIVVGSHGRSGLTRLLLGSVSEAIVRHARCSVEVVRVAQPDVARLEIPAASSGAFVQGTVN
jgi:nucleotide-binding universal stress UspA family protein